MHAPTCPRCGAPLSVAGDWPGGRVEPQCRFCGQGIVAPAPPPVVRPEAPRPEVPRPSPAPRAWGLWIPIGLSFLAVPIALVFSLSGAGTPSSLLPSSPVSCGQGDSVELIGLTKDIPGGVAVEARDGCRLKIAGGTFRGKIGVRATGRAIVTIEGAVIEGSEMGVVTDGSSKVTLTQSSIQAPVAVKASEQAFVILEMGQARGSVAAIEARGRARVDVKGAVVSGKTVNDPGARVVLER